MTEFEILMRCAVCDASVHAPYRSMPGENYAVCSEECLSMWIDVQTLLGWYHLSSGTHYEIVTKNKSPMNWDSDKNRKNCYYTGAR